MGRITGYPEEDDVTSGKPSGDNALPHFDSKTDIAIVHNGMIKNYAELKRMLKNEGHLFNSEADSEIIALLIEKFYVGSLMDSVTKALSMIDGTFRLVVISYKEDKIIAAKRGFPLLIGLGEEEILVASDISALISHTKKIIYLKENEITEIRKDSYTITNMGDLA